MLPGGWDGHHDDFAWRGPGMIRLHPIGCAYSVLRRWNPDTGRYQGWYVNLEQPWRRTPIGFDTRDDVLDVTVDDDLTAWQLKDDDELAWSVQAGQFSATEAARIHQTAETAISRIEARVWPFEDNAWSAFAPDPRWPAPHLPEHWDDIFGP